MVEMEEAGVQTFITAQRNHCQSPTHWTELEYSGPGGFRRSTADVVADCGTRGHHYLRVARATTCMLGCGGWPWNNLADDG